jgi:hypothetical protein
MKSTLVRKKIGDKIYQEFTQERMVKIVTNSSYTTNGESILIIKDSPICNLYLDSSTTKTIKIKAMTKVSIIPKNSSIDEFYDELVIEKGACVELEFVDNSWYILSSDGLKLN